MRDVEGTSVRHSSVAENGVSDVVCTSSIVGGGPTGTTAVVVVSIGVDVVGGASGTVGSARNLRSLAYAESYEPSKLSGVEAEVVPPERIAAETSESGRRPGISGPPVSSPGGRTGRPPGG